MGWGSRIGLRALWVGVVGATLGLAVAAPVPGPSPAAPVHGERLVGRYQIGAESIARYAALAAGQQGHERTRAESLLADRAPWIGPFQPAGAGHNPYTLVLSVTGTARSAGEVYAHWQAGWEVQESRHASREVLAPVARATRPGRAAGERVTMTVHSLPVSFRGERNVAPMLGLVQTRNFEISAVEVEIWSGTARQALAAPPRGALLALAGAGLLVFLPLGRRRHDKTPAEARPSRLPVVVEEPAPAAAAEAASPPTPVPAPAPAAPDHGRRVRETLLQVLTGGVTVRTEYDERHPPRRRRSKARPAAH